jgi:hypothetical protein
LGLQEGARKESPWSLHSSTPRCLNSRTLMDSAWRRQTETHRTNVSPSS